MYNLRLFEQDAPIHASPSTDHRRFSDKHELYTGLTNRAVLFTQKLLMVFFYLEHNQPRVLIERLYAVRAVLRGGLKTKSWF